MSKTAPATADTDDATASSAVTITLNGSEVAAAEGQLLIEACEEAGAYIPRFCYHPRMRSVGMCRMCLVDVDTGRGPTLQPSCMIDVQEGMVVETESPAAQKAQEGVLEFLLVNHPLDCPVCDKGGECPLQDQTMAYGPGETRFVESKRHFAKPIGISDNVYLDRERCILCDRCTRFASEVAGDALISFVDRGNHTQVNTFPDEPFSSYFSGNTVQICPVGALTAEPYRFKARPWDLQESVSTFPNPVGDRILVESSRDEILRYQGLDSEATNHGWLTDRDRFSFQAASSPNRLTEPQVRSSSGQLVPASWGEAMDTVEQTVKAAIESLGPESVGIIGGAHLTCEAQYAWAKLAKAVWGCDNIDAQLDDGLDAGLVLGLPRATIAEACTGTTLLIAADPKEELGTLYLRLRTQAEAGNLKLLEITPTETGLTSLATNSLRVLPGDEPEVVATLLADDPVEFAREAGTPQDGNIGISPVQQIAAFSEMLKDSAASSTEDTSLTVIFGRSCMSASGDVTASAVAEIAQKFPLAKFLPALRRGNIHGALEMGLSPGLLPGEVKLAEDGNWYASIWGNLPKQAGFGARELIAKAATGELAVLICLGSDPVRDFPHFQLMEEALDVGTNLIAISTFPTATTEAASVVLPAAGFGEREGTHMNMEGRLSPVSKQINPPGTARPDWMIATELAHRFGIEWDFTTSESIWEEISEIVPKFSGIRAADIRTAPDGILVGAGTTPSGTASASPAASPVASPAEASEQTLNFPKPEPVPHDRYAYRLVIDRSLYDQGTLVSNCPALAPLAEPSVARLHINSMRELGTQDGDLITLASAAGKLEIPVKTDNRVPQGAVAVAHNRWLPQGAPGAQDLQGDPRDLIVPDTSATEVRITTSK